MEPDSTRPFGQLLREYRLASGLTQEALAERAALSVHGIQKLERGMTRPFRDTVERIIAALQLSESEEATLRAATVPVRRHGTGWGLASSSDRHHNVPNPLTSLIGRTHELEELSQLALQHRLVTLLGTGGCGKTRLAIALARGLVANFPDGVWFVELAPVADPGLVAHQIGTAVGVQQIAGEELSETVARALGSQRVLLIADNCEHVLDACASVLERILLKCDDVRIVTTSREPIRVAGEVCWRVPSLDAPVENSDGTLSTYLENPAIQLFVERAAAAQPRFELTEANAADVAQICRRLDGIPLALELAAARIAMLVPKELLARLDQRFRLLTGGTRTALPRHQTLQATMDWSYRLLTRAEQQLFDRLSVFAGGWDLAAAEAVCGPEDALHQHIVELLGDLVEKSLVVVSETADGDSRFNYLETVREYARITLASRDSSEIESRRRLHATYYAHLAEQLNPDVLTFEADVRRLELEQDNIRSALGWCIENHHAALGLRIANAMQSCWFARGSYGEARWWFDGLLKLTDSSTPTERADDDNDAVTPLQRAFALRGAAVIVGNTGDAARARALIGEAAAIMEKLDRGSPVHAQALALRGISEWVQGDTRSAIDSALEALRYSREAAAPAVISVSLQVLGYIALSQARYDDTVQLLTESDAANPASGWWSRNVEAELAGLLARAYYLCGAYDKARTHFRKSLEIVRADHIRSYVLGHCLEWYASLECTLGSPIDAAVLYGAAEAVWRVGGGVRWAPWQSSYAREVAELDAQLDSQQRAAAWRRGTRLSAEEAIDYALRVSAVSV